MIATTYSPTRRALLAGGVAAAIAPALGAPSLALAATDVAHVTAPRRLGDDAAPIKVVELFSMTCPHCANFHNDTFPEVKTRLIDTGMVQFEMRQAAYKKWDVKSTPSFVVNGKTVLSGAMTYEDFAAKINATDA
jgi:protein-disulfide isomerase